MSRQWTDISERDGVVEALTSARPKPPIAACQTAFLVIIVRQALLLSCFLAATTKPVTGLLWSCRKMSETIRRTLKPA